MEDDKYLQRQAGGYAGYSGNWVITDFGFGLIWGVNTNFPVRQYKYCVLIGSIAEIC